MRLPAPNGKIVHAALKIKGAMVMLVDEMDVNAGEVADRSSKSPKSLKGTPVTIHMTVVERATLADMIEDEIKEAAQKAMGG